MPANKLLQTSLEPADTVDCNNITRKDIVHTGKTQRRSLDNVQVPAVGVLVDPSTVHPRRQTRVHVTTGRKLTMKEVFELWRSFTEHGSANDSEHRIVSSRAQ